MKAWFYSSFALSALALLLANFSLSADELRIKNGDVYHGKVLSMTASNLVLASEILGRITIPRSHVSAISLVPVQTARALTNASADTNRMTLAAADPSLTPLLRNLGSQTNLTKQVQAQMLSEAGPEATTKFNDLLGGLITGRISLSDLRTQAKSTADQVRAMKSDLGPEASGMLDGYLVILDNFLKETSPSGTSATKPAAR